MRLRGMAEAQRWTAPGRPAVSPNQKNKSGALAWCFVLTLPDERLQGSGLFFDSLRQLARKRLNWLMASPVLRLRGGCHPG